MKSLPTYTELFYLFKFFFRYFYNTKSTTLYRVYRTAVDHELDAEVIHDDVLYMYDMTTYDKSLQVFFLFVFSSMESLF